MEFSVSRPALLKFLRKAVYDGKNGDTARMFVLKRSIGGKPTQQVDDWAVTKEFDADKIVDGVIESATEDSQGIDEKQSYELQAYFGTSKIAGRRKSFDIDPAIFDDEDEMEDRVSRKRNGSEGAFRTQIWRHNEAYAKMHIVGTGETVKMFRAQVADMMEQIQSKDRIIAQLVGGHVDTVKRHAELTESLISQDHKRKMEVMEKEQEHQLKAATIKLLTPVANQALQQLAGRMLTSGTPPTPTEVAETAHKSSTPLSEYAQVILAFENTFSDDNAFLTVVQSNVFSQEQIGLIARLMQMAKAEQAAAN